MSRSFFSDWVRSFFLDWVRKFFFIWVRKFFLISHSIDIKKKLAQKVAFRLCLLKLKKDTCSQIMNASGFGLPFLPAPEEGSLFSKKA